MANTATAAPKPSADTPASERKMLLGALVMPLFMMIVLPLLYSWGFHSPTPHHMRVQIIGTSPQTTALAAGLELKAGSSFDVTTAPDADAARAAILRLDSRGAYDPATNTAYVASAGNLAATQVAETLFQSITGQTGAPAPTVVDLQPPGHKDVLGNTVLFLGLAAILGGFLTATVIQLLTPGLSLRVELTILAGAAVTSAVIPLFTAYAVYGALSGPYFRVGALLAASSFIIGAFHLGGMRLIGPAQMIPTILVMVLLGVPASGAAIAQEMVPGFFGTLHSILPTPALLEGLKRTVYFPDAGVGATEAVMACWALLAAALLGAAFLKHPKQNPPLPVAFGNAEPDTEDDLDPDVATTETQETR